MNENHAWCGSDDWRAIVRDHIIPWALADADLGDDVLEVGPGYGATTDEFRRRVDRLTAVEIDPALAEPLAERFKGTNVTVVEGDATALTFKPHRFSGATCFHMLHHVPSAALQNQIFSEIARVLRPGGILVAADSVYSPELERFHEGDTYFPVDPATLDERLRRCGFTAIEVALGDFGWAFRALTPLSSCETQGSSSR